MTSVLPMRFQAMKNREGILSWALMKSTFSAFFLLMQLACLGQNIATENSVPIVAYWQKGDIKNVTITRAVQKSENGKPVSQTSSTCRATLLVRDSTAEGYTIEWTYKYAEHKDARLRGMDALFNNLKVVYATDDVGSFKELLNEKDIRAYLESVVKELTSIKGDSAAHQFILSQVKGLFSSRESLEQLLLRDISLFHTPYGVEYTMDTLKAETELPNFLGGDPWPGVIRLGLKKKPAGPIASLYMHMEIDKVKAASNIRAFARKIADANGKEIPEDVLPSLLEISDRSEFECILETGWMKKAYLQRTARTGSLQKVETLLVLMD